ncbi:MAG: prolipoprotein diacylglyceryl transferase [Oscillospiraceae bacterium]|nr:prolipoprotein diacylglyceryl transferase [Oscillospiraceae bacterium]MDY6208722.1 prolipoprotein diacylglyceryl transferase [Oscillospiraceae bacterium]
MNEVGRLYGDNIVFPGLGIDITVDNEAFSLFGLSIKWYGVVIALGMLLAMIYCFKRTKEFGIDGDRLTDAVFAGLIGAVIGARLYYVILHAESFHDIKEIFAIRDGGLAIYGGIIGALLFGCITAKLRKLRILPTLDLAAMGFLIGQSLGRWGNFFNQEAFGCNTTLPWGMSGGRIQQYLANHQASLAAQGMEVNPYLPVHPCFLYESIWCAVGFLILHFYHKHRKFDGEVFCMYVFWYGLGRFFIEGLRTDSLYIGSVRASQMLALISAIAALAIIIIMRVRVKKKGVALYCDSEESKKILEAAANAEKEEVERKAAKKHKELTAEQKIVEDDDDEEDNT